MSKIAILTNMMEFNPGYSLTGIIKDQVLMLSRHGHTVHLYVNDQYHGEDFPGEVVLEKKIPFGHLVDFKSAKELTPELELISNNMAVMLEKEMTQFKYVFTHDFVFTGWFYPYGLGIQKASKKLPDVRWFHWVHSVPTAMSDWWDVRLYGKTHKIVFPNETDRLRVAEQFRGKIKDVRVIPHIKDMRSWFDFCDDTCEFIDDFPAVMQADVVQIYPASTDRLTPKGVKTVIKIFSRIKKRGFSVCLVIANQWATGRQRKEDVQKFMRIVQRNGLDLNKEVIFTSEWKEEFATGIPKIVLRELFQLSNLFIFPTREESFGLVSLEAALAGGVLLVLNKSLQMQLEVNGFTGLYFDFGSFHQNFEMEDEDMYLNEISAIILGRIKQNESINSKTFMRQRYNYDSLYRQYYEPVMAESSTW